MDEIDEIFKDTDSQISALQAETHKNTDEIKRAHGIVENTSSIMADLEKEFCRKTSLNLSDIRFLFLATALQVTRIILIN